MLHLMLHCLAWSAGARLQRAVHLLQTRLQSAPHNTLQWRPSLQFSAAAESENKEISFYIFQDGRGARSLPAPEHPGVRPQQPQHRADGRAARHHLHQGVQQASQNIRSFVLCYHKCK